MLSNVTAMITPRTPQGVHELLPAKQLAFQRMLDTIRRGFERFGFLPIETPVFERTDVLLTKTGGETEKQVYFVQSTGALEQKQAPDMALRFDLTVPLARYVAEHEHELVFPFRRYQIQRVYRGERSQKGRFREFYQCDIDVLDRDRLPLAYDAELPALIHGIFTGLAFGRFTIFINNRKLLRGLLDTLGYATAQHDAVLHAVDRLRKTGVDKVAEELDKAVPGARNADLLAALRGSLDDLAAIASSAPALAEGLAELRAVHAGTLALGVPASALQIDLSIVRGLDYYTGTIYETFLGDLPGIGSICSGGRYDNLAGLYTKTKLPGVGISIGATRLFDQLDQLGMLPHAPGAVAHVLVLYAPSAAAIGTQLRDAGLNVEVYASDDKLGKQFKYADKARVPLVVIPPGPQGSPGPGAGDAPIKVKDMRVTDGRAPEIEVAPGELVARIKALLA